MNNQNLKGLIVIAVALTIVSWVLGMLIVREILPAWAMLGQIFRLDGVPAEEWGRCAEVIAPAGESVDAVGGARPEGSMAWMTFNNPPRRPSAMSSAAWRAAEIPSSNGHGSARGIARFYGALGLGGEVDGVRLLSGRTLEAAVEEQRRGVDAIIGLDMRWALAFGLPNPHLGDVRGPRAFGHAGAGGSLGFADPDHRLGFAYVMNQMGPLIDRRSMNLAAAVYAGLRG